MTPEKAQSEIEKILPDYTRPLPQSVKVLRDSAVAPFISWSYYVLPNIIRLAKKNKWRAAAVLGAPMLMSEAWMQMQDQSNADLPTDTIGRRLATNVDEAGNIDTLKVDRILPGFDIANIPMSAVINGVKGIDDEGVVHGVYEASKSGIRAGVNFITSTILSGPTVGTAVAALTGKDAYSGRPIIGSKKEQSDLDELSNLSRWGVNTFLPIPLEAMALYDFGKGQVLEEEKRKQFHDIVPRTTTQQVLKLFGVNTMTYDPEATAKENK